MTTEEMLTALAKASGRPIPDDRLKEMVAAYQAVEVDSRPLRETEITHVPANVYKAD